MSEEQTPQSEANIPSSDEPKASDIPTANTPDPAAANPEVNADATGEKPDSDSAAKEQKKAAAKPAGDKPPAKAKKEKPPAVEDKPFPEFIEQEYLPALKTAFTKEGISDVEVAFVKDKIKISGLSKPDTCWQVVGKWKNGQRQFNIYFPEEDISKSKAFSLATNGAKAGTLESFMIDERKVTLDLIVFYTMQRLNAEKWLAWN
ncbi:MAG: DUF2996 domain-containing protein [Coleofasciculaceae cyanobacterium]